MRSPFPSTFRWPARFVLIAILAASTSALAADLTWTGSASADWNNPTNWAPEQVPTASDHVIINSGSVTIPADGAFGVMDWTGGGIYGSLTVASNGVMNIGGGGPNYLYAYLTNSGTVNWTGGDLDVSRYYDGGVFIFNQAGGQWNILCDQSLTHDVYSGAYFQNAGTVQKSASIGTTTVNIPFNNAGTVEVDQGIIGLENGGSLGGAFAAGPGAAIDFDAGTFSLISGPPVSSGPGQVQFTSGASVSFSGPITNFSLSVPSLVGDNVVTGTLNWTGGGIYGSLTVAGSGVMNIGGGGPNYLYAYLTNSGTVNWTGGDLGVSRCYDGGVFIFNLAGGQWNILCDQSLMPYQCGSAYFQNAGAVEKSASTGTTTVNIPFNNTGTVEADQGTVGLESGGSLGGAFAAGPGAAIDFDGGTFSLISGPPVSSGSGQVQFTSGASVTFTGPITNFSLSVPSLVGDNVVTGTLNWTGGGIFGSLTVAGSGVMNIGGGPNYLYAYLTNSGTVNWTGGDLGVSRCYDGGVFIFNLAGGRWNILCDQSLTDYQCGVAYFENAGTVQKSAGTGATSIGIPFNNSGTVETEMGMISFQGGYSGSSSANLAVSLGGAAPGSGYGTIAFSTPLSLGGAFTVSKSGGYLPNPGTAFHVLSYPSATGSFSCLSGLDLGGGILLQPQFGPAGLTLLATAYTTNASLPQLFINRSPGGVVVVWPVGFPGWTLESTTNLSSPSWTAVSNACGNQAVVPTSAPQQLFRLSQQL